MNAALKNPYLDLQFSIGSIMCTTGTFAVLLTYLKTFAPNEFLVRHSNHRSDHVGRYPRGLLLASHL